jgi:membrane-associated protease RseP (regulator of RpoE activity)
VAAARWLRTAGGDVPAGPPGSKGRLAEFADSAREAERDDITETDIRTGRLFYQKKTWQKLIIMAGGPLMNILLAFFIFLGINLAYGQQHVGGDPRSRCSRCAPR